MSHVGLGWDGGLRLVALSWLELDWGCLLELVWFELS